MPFGLPNIRVDPTKQAQRVPPPQQYYDNPPSYDSSSSRASFSSDSKATSSMLERSSTDESLLKPAQEQQPKKRKPSLAKKYLRMGGANSVAESWKEKDNLLKVAILGFKPPS